MSPEFDQFLEKINKGSDQFPQTHSIHVPDQILKPTAEIADKNVDEQKDNIPTNSDEAKAHSAQID